MGDQEESQRNGGGVQPSERSERHPARPRRPLDPRSARGSSRSRQDNPYRRYQRIANKTASGRRTLMNPDGSLTGPPGRRALHQAPGHSWALRAHIRTSAVPSTYSRHRSTSACRRAPADTAHLPARRDAFRNVGHHDEGLAQGMLDMGKVWPVALSMSAARSTRTVMGRTSAIAFATVASLAP